MTESPGLARGDRIVFLGRCGPRGKHGEIVAVFGARPRFATVRYDHDPQPRLTLAGDCHPIPRRPPPDFD